MLIKTTITKAIKMHPILLTKIQLNYLQLLAISAFGYVVVKIILVFMYYTTRSAKIKLGSKIKPEASKAVLITGATSGFGLCLAKRLHKLGFTVFACYYSELEPGYSELSQLEKTTTNNTSGDGATSGETSLLMSKRMFLIPLDVTSRDSIANCHKLAERYLADHKLKLHAVVNNAGCNYDGPFPWTDADLLRRMLDTNLVGCIMVSRQFVNRIIQDKGRFVNVSSGMSVMPFDSTATYGATKTGIAYFSEVLHLDLQQYGASSCCLLPANFMASTNMIFTRLKSGQESVQNLEPGESELYAKSIEETSAMNEFFVLKRLKRLGKEADVAELEKCYDVSLKKVAELDQQITQRRAAFNHLKRLTDMLKSSLARPFLGLVSATEDPHDDLEKSGIMPTLDAALLLESPPRRLFMGSWSYTYAVGPLAELLPSVIYRYLGPFIWGVFMEENRRQAGLA